MRGVFKVFLVTMQSFEVAGNVNHLGSRPMTSIVVYPLS
jgi:hypothetical protein